MTAVLKLIASGFIQLDFARDMEAAVSKVEAMAVRK